MIFIEAHTGKTRLDSHYSFPNKKIQAYVEDDNDILIEDDIMKALSFNGGIYGTADVIVDEAALFGKKYLNKLTSKSILEHGRQINYVDRKILCM